jgi:High potential iron-sulfur protein
MSRRAALRSVASAVAAAPVLLTMAHSATAATKVSKSAAGYRASPNGKQSCANCRVFIPPSSCQLVEGPISARGWCKLWVSK